MTENHSLQSGAAVVPSISFTPTPYRADGAFSFGSGMQLVGLLGILGILLGVLAGFISRIFYLVLLFPIVIGGCIGTVGSYCIRRFHVRNPLMCGAAGFVAGCLAMFTMHYTEFKFFEKNMAESLGEEGREVQQIALRADEIHAHWEQATEVEQAIITELEMNPAGLRALQADNIWKYIDMIARQGVEINPNAGGPGRGINLGYTGSYIYWGVEMLIVAGLAFSLMSHAAGEPYCNECGTWKVAQLFGPFAESQELARSIQQGTLTPFARQSETSPVDGMIAIFSCPACQPHGETDVRVERWTVNKKGETIKKRLTQMTYPAEAFPVLQVVCATPEPEPELTPASAPEAEMNSTDTPTWESV